MNEILELIPAEAGVPKPLFATAADYERFRESFMDAVIPQQEAWREARIRSAEEAGRRIVR